MALGAGGPPPGGPWGSGPGSVPPGNDPGGDGPRRNPWGGPGGSGPGGRGPGGRGPGGRGPGGQGPGLPPEIEALIARAQSWLRRTLGGGGGRTGGSGGGGGGSGAGGSGGGGWGNRRTLTVIGVAVVALWLASGFYVVQPDELGMVLRFGAFTRSAPPGLNYHLPWPIEEALLPKVTRVNRTDVGFRPRSDGSAVQVPKEAHLLTGDENIVAVNATVFWRISNPQEYLFDIRDPAQLVKQMTESSLREEVGLMSLDPVLTSGRAKIEQTVLKNTQDRLRAYHAGVEVLEVQLQRVDPPAEVIPAFRDVQAAREDARRAVNQAESYRNNIVPRARGQAAQIVLAANGEKSALIAHATGAAKRFDSVVTAYRAAREVTLERMYIETMQDVLGQAATTVVGQGVSGVLPLLPLGPGAAALSPAGAPPSAPPVAPPAAIKGAGK